MRRPIVTVTPNPALDLTYHLSHLEAGGSNRVAQPSARAGGKGINVARVLQKLGHPTLSVAPLGGPLAARIHSDCAASGLPLEAVSIAGHTRQTITIVDGRSNATVLNEAGPDLSQPEWTELLSTVERKLVGAAALVVAGSLPGSTPPTMISEFVSLAHRQGVPCVVDTSGEALICAAVAQADVVKPNLAELRQATGIENIEEASTALLEAGALRVVVSQGEDGLTAHDATLHWHVGGLPVQQGNPTGAGDAAVAGLALAVATKMAWSEGLRLACALGAAAARQPTAGAVSPADVKALLPQVRISSKRRADTKPD